MLLSEAIRLGAMLRPQAFGDVQFSGGTCALGAAYDAAGLLEGVDERDLEEEILAAFPILNTPRLVCHLCGQVPMHVLSVFATNVAHLNDEHRLPREAIADWVATVEPRQAQPEPERIPVAISAVART